MSELTGIQLPDYLVMFSYFALVIIVGVYFSRFIKMAKDFFTAGSIMPWWLAGTSFYMASFSTLLFVIYNEISYKYGFVAVTICWVSPIAFLLGGYFTATRWRRSRILTPIGFIERRYNRKVHHIFVWTGFPLRLLDNSLKILSTTIVMVVALQNPHITFNGFALFFGTLMIVFALLGGQLAVIITDFVQAVILAVAVIVLFVLTLKHPDVGGFSGFFARIPDGFMNPVSGKYTWSFLFFTVFISSFLTYNASWALVQKFNTVRSERDARKMVYWIAFLMFIFPPVFFFPGMAARILMPGLEGEATRTAYAAISLKILPIGLMGFLLSAMLSATMSTLSSEYNTLSGVLTREFYKKIINPNASERTEIFMGRMFTFVIGMITLLIAMGINRIEGKELIELMFMSFAAYSPPIMIPLITGLLSRRFNAHGVFMGMIGGFVIGSLIIIAWYWKAGFNPAILTGPFWDRWLGEQAESATIVITTLVTLSGMWIGSTTRETPREERERVEEFFTLLKQPFKLEEQDRNRTSPFGIIGSTLIGLGCAMSIISVIVLIGFKNPRAFIIDLIVGLLMVVLGFLMRVVTGREDSPGEGAASHSPRNG